MLSREAASAGYQMTVIETTNDLTSAADEHVLVLQQSVPRKCPMQEKRFMLLSYVCERERERVGEFESEREKQPSVG